jgi:hypothetical protein
MVFRLTLMGFILTMLMGWGPLCAQPTDTAESVLDLHRQKFQWMVARDTDSLADLLAKDVVYVHSNGWHETRTDVLQNIASGRLRYHDVQVLRAQVRAYGDTWIVNGRGRFDVALEDEAWILLLDYTEVYIRQQDTYTLVSRHACRVPEPE